MSVNRFQHVLVCALAGSTFLAGVPALAQSSLNRTGAGMMQGQCLCMTAIRATVSDDLSASTRILNEFEATPIPEMVACGESGGVLMGDTCLSVASLRGPQGEPGEMGPPGADGVNRWLSLSSGGGGDGDGGAVGGYDTDGDGIGDFGTQAEAVAAGAGFGTAVGNCGSCGAGGGGGGSSGKIICGELYRQGYLPRHIYAADLRYYKYHANPEAARAYYAWARPYVRLMRRSWLATQIIRPLGTLWAHQMAYEMGAIDRAPPLGRLTTGLLTRLHERLGAWLDRAAAAATPPERRPARTAKTVHLLPVDFWSNIVKA